VRWLAGTILLLLLIASSSGQQQPKITGFFTDMHYIQEAGDVLGTEVWIVYARGKFYATVQDAEGEPDPPFVVPVEVSGSRIKFTIREPLVFGDGRPAPDSVLNYTGTVTRAGLMLSVNSHSQMLRRGNSYWQ
jgi:hypothetical protein